MQTMTMKADSELDSSESDLRSDLVAFIHLQKQATIIELTICYEAYKAAQDRKIPVSEVESIGFNTELITLKVGSWGLVCLDGFRETISGGKRKINGENYFKMGETTTIIS